MANRGWDYPKGEDPNSVEAPILFKDFFNDDVYEGDEYWEIFGDIVLDENLNKYIKSEFVMKVAGREYYDF